MLAIDIKNVSKTYADGFVALKDISLEIKKGDFFALLGPNGAGKSTTIGIISSLVNKSSGNVSICGVDVDEDFNKAKSYLGVVPQEVNLSIFETVEQIILNQAGYYGVSRSLANTRLDFLLKKLDIYDKKHAQIRMLSGGMKRRVMIARALIHNPQVLILDEPTAGVDVELRHLMWNFIQELHDGGMTIILTTHYLEEAEQLAKNIAIINNGEIIENTTVKELLKQLDKEMYIIDSKEFLPTKLHIKGVEFSKVDETTIEVVIDKQSSINAIIKELDSQGVEISGIRNKQNRLEALFIQKTKKDNFDKGGKN
ncbi:MAG: ABC transporter ATP-binding protein [Nanoarchaeota archaeon]|nr:ABC transporter ATP-binding protein [Nanoarchaeota archaeon]